MRPFFILIFIFSLFSVSGVDPLIISIPVKNNLNMMIAEEIVSSAYRNAGIEYTFVKYSLEKSLVLIRKGSIDGELVRAKNIVINNPEIVLVDVPVLSVDTVAFYKNPSIVINNWEDVSKYRVSYERGIKLIENNMPYCEKLYPANTILDAFRLLDTGRVDIVITGKINGLYNISLLEIDSFLISDPLVHLDLYHILHKRNNYLKPKLELELSKINRDEIYNNIIKKELENIN